MSATQRSESGAAMSTKPKPKKNTAEYQRDKRLRQAAKRETTKNSWFQRVALSWPAPRQGDGQSA